ncbi:TIGR01458 family HAD-type hydrolase [Uliginosibacterium sp. 31-16]|uniref:TIGR01458 family HAD-type hydrolase n=1 Tax=Uliginosibacterium sp. 31-16 TaxID=3068315 RepID=UPI00273CF748|nr:TIGR01458 family HAD-type hydrolase [Uliginosibacterium sp. 31-16]MDP5237986.1 TIGR01458 family HAD-type hydrolase [Uliginosibacterium sp. 31-16]
MMAAQAFGSDRPKGILIDLAGVLHTGNTPIPRSLAALHYLRRAKIPLRFLTNTTRSPRTSIVRMLAGMGFDVEESEIITAVHATRQHVQARGLHPHWLVHPDVRDEVGPDATEPNVVLLGDAGPHFSFEAMNTAFRLLMRGLPLIAMARNRYFQEADGLTLDMGAYVTALEYSAGVQATIIGKPAPAFFAAALADMNAAAEDALMIGDDLRDDVQGAQAAGIRAILVRTGKYRPQDETAPGERPALIADDFAAAVSAILGDSSLRLPTT